jgi:predicted DNA-binding transcriptional regulator YafY
MTKAKRLNEMIMMVNRKKRFTVGELAKEFGVSNRTILRDLQELCEMGVPLYSEVGPHGGYQVLKERILPPIAFSEEEAKAIFFSIHALRHYISLPFNIEYESIKRKFYINLSGDTRDAIDRIKDRVDFLSGYQQEEVKFLRQILDAAIQQEAIIIDYETNEKVSRRCIQPIGISAKWPSIELCKEEDGTGFLKGKISGQEINFFSDYFIGYGRDAVVIEPIELIDGIKEKLNIILMQYIKSD